MDENQNTKPNSDDNEAESDNPSWSGDTKKLDADKVVETVYEDGLQGAVKQYGKGFEKHAETIGDNVGQSLTKITGAVNIVLDKIGELSIWSYKQIREKLGSAVSKKLEHTNPENIVPPPVYVAAPAIEAFRFTQDQPELQDMFASLLASSMNKNTQPGVHPAFVEIINSCPLLKLQY